MATTTTVNSNFVGSVAGGIIGASFKEADTLRLGLVTLAENVPFKMNLRKIRYSDGTENYSCGFAPAGAIVLSEKVIEPKKVMNAMQICKEDFRATWSGDTMGGSASNATAPADIMEAIQVEVLSSQAELVDDQIWNGVNATNGQIGDGLIVQWAADNAAGGVIQAGNGITALNAATNEANVIAHIKAALAAVPVKLRRKALTVVVSPDVMQAYMFRMISLNQTVNAESGEKQANFGRYTLTEVNGLNDNTIAVYDKSNVIFATGLNADFNELSLVDEDEIGLLTGQIRGKMVYSGGMGYYNSSEIVYLLTTEA